MVDATWVLTVLDAGFHKGWRDEEVGEGEYLAWLSLWEGKGRCRMNRNLGCDHLDGE